MIHWKKTEPLKGNRPLHRIDMQPFDWILEGLTIVALVSFFGILLYQYRLLPDTIPTHFNSSGKPDDYGRKDAIWVLPVIALVTYAILTMVSRFPQSFNFPVNITHANAKKQYTMAIRLIRILKLIVVLIFFYIGIGTVSVARNQDQTIGLWFLPVVLGLTLLPIGIYFFLSQRSR